MGRIEMIYIGRRITTDKKLKRFWLKLDAEGKHADEDESVSFEKDGPKGVSGLEIGAVFAFTTDGENKYTMGGKDGPSFVRRWGDESEIAGWEATTLAQRAELEAHKRAKQAMSDEAIVNILRPIARAGQRSDSFGRAALRLRVLACLDKAMGYR